MRLPKKVKIKFNDLIDNAYLEYEDIVEEDEDYLADAISDYLSDKYEYCHYGFDIEEIDFEKKVILVTNIKWDTSD